MSKKIKWSNRLTERSSEHFSAPFVKWVKQREAAAYINRITKERDEAQECLREIVSQLTMIDARASGETWHMGSCDGDEVARWRKAAGLEEEQ